MLPPSVSKKVFLRSTVYDMGPCRKVCALLKRPWRNAYMHNEVNMVTGFPDKTYVIKYLIRNCDVPVRSTLM